LIRNTMITIQRHMFLDWLVPQANFTYTCERRSWPDKELHQFLSDSIHRLPEAVAISPRGNLAFFQWFDSWGSQGWSSYPHERCDFQLLNTGLPLSSQRSLNVLRSMANGDPIGSNLATLRSVQSRWMFIVLACRCWSWWADLLQGAVCE